MPSSLAGFPRCAAAADASLAYPLGALEIVQPRAAAGFVVRERGRGKSRCLSRIRRCDGKYGWLQLHPRKACSHSAKARKTCAHPHYWHISVQCTGPKGEYWDHVPYCRVLSWAFLKGASDATQGLTDSEWAIQAATHHSRTARVRWQGKQITVKDDRALKGLKALTRAAHHALHHGSSE